MTLTEAASFFALLHCVFTGSLRDSSHFSLSNFFLLEYLYRCFNATSFYSKHTRVFSKLLKSIGSLTFDNQDGRGGQALHISVNNADIFPSMVQLDVANHQIPWYTLEWNMIVEKIKLSKSCCVISSLRFWLWDVWNIYNALHNHIVCRPLIFASLQTPTTDMADVLCTNNAIGCPSGTTQPTSPCKQLPAIQRTHKTNRSSKLARKS